MVTTRPIVKELLNGYEFLWCEGDEWVITIKIIKVIESHGALYGEFSIEHEFKDRPTISGVRFNLTSQQARNTLTKRLVDSKIIPSLDWADIINQVCSETIKLQRQGEPVKELWTSDELLPLEYLIEPILLKGIPTVIFGEKGVTKSTLSLVLYAMLTLPWHDNPLGLKAPDHSIKTLILDWEVSGGISQWNAKKLQEGMDLPPFSLYHRRCNRSLSDDLETILESITNMKVEVVIIDSLARAAGGELSKDTENANRFFTSLDKLNVSSLILAQTSKDREAKTKTIYGNALYTYYARSIFELCKSQDIGDDEISVALFHRSSNLTRLQKPIGFRISFNGAGTHIAREALDVQEFKAKLSGQQLLLESLKEGKKDAKTLAAELQWEEASVRTLLSRLKKKGKVTSLGEGQWGLLAKV